MLVILLNQHFIEYHKTNVVYTNTKPDAFINILSPAVKRKLLLHEIIPAANSCGRLFSVSYKPNSSQFLTSSKEKEIWEIEKCSIIVIN